MRQSNTSEEFSRNNLNREKRGNEQNQGQNYDQDDDSVNCPMIFKTCLVTLVTLGILAFVISFGVEIENSPDLMTGDFSNCGDHSNVRRLLKSYAYEKIILGLLISAVVISFGLTVFMFYQSYQYCQCFGECCFDQNDSQSSNSQNVDINQYQIEMKKRLVSNILMPKSQIHTNSYLHNQSEKKIRRKELKIEEKIEHIKSLKGRRLKKSRQEIERFNQNYSKYIKNSQQNQCDCQCDDCTSCFAYCIGCLWCKSCFDAHHYHFYNSKTQQYSYWIVYMVKTFIFGSALAYAIRIYVSLKQMDYCESDNSKLYANNIEVPMIIGIVTAVIDFIGYIHLFVQGTLLDIVEHTLHSQSKSQHSDSDSDGQSFDDHHKKQGKKYQRSEQSYSSDKKSPKKDKKVFFKNNRQQNKQPVQNATNDNLLRSLKNKKYEKQKQPESKDTDSFFITLKTLGNRYLDNIENQSDKNEQKYRKKNKKVVQQYESYQGSDKKPRIEVPQSIDKLPRKKVLQMKRQQAENQQNSLRQSIDIEKIKNEDKDDDQEEENKKETNLNKNIYSYPNPKTYGKFGGYNREKF